MEERRRGPEHEPDHDRASQAADEDGCRTCRVLHAIPAWWGSSGGRHCAVVPVQTVETWLLCIRGDDFAGDPERSFDRWVLKKRFFGKPLPSEAVRAAAALAQVDVPRALETLRKRPSFRLFEEQVTGWR